MAAKAKPSMLRLAAEIQSLTSQIINELSTTDKQEPDFTVGSSEVPDTTTYNQLRNSLNDAAQDLLLLVNGPKAHARQYLCTHHELAAYQIAFDFDFFHLVPLEGYITADELACKAALEKDIILRVMYTLCTQRVFAEVAKETFEHTHGSIVFTRDIGLHCAGQYQLDEFLRAAAYTSVSLQKSTRSPFEEAFDAPLFEYYAEYPQLGARFASAMAGIATLDRHIEGLQDGYDWRKLGQRLVVDIGGGSGHISIALAKAFPNLRIVVQDGNPVMFETTSKQTTGPVGEGRVTFLKHDFFVSQPIFEAGAYLLRQITHNWGDEKCVQIFKALVPALELAPPGTPLLINDTIVPEHNSISRYEERGLRQVDLMMLVALGAKQRTLKEFARLLTEADSRLKIVKARDSGALGLIQVQLID